MVATAGGAFLGVAPLVGGLGAAVWIVVFFTLRYPSLASIVSETMYGRSFPVVAVEPVEFAALMTGDRLRIERNGRIHHTDGETGRG